MTAEGLAAWGARLETWDGTFRSAQDPDGQPPTNWLGDSFPSMYMAGGIAVMEVSGPMMFKTSFVEKNLGAFDYQTLTDWTEQAQNQNAKGALLYVSTNGGASAGNIECAECVAQLAARMPVGVFVDQVAASAGYAIARPQGISWLRRRRSWAQ
jgi:ClpP class serine protease